MTEPTRTEQLVSQPRSLPLHTVELVVIEGPDRGARQRIAGTTRIGTARGSELRLNDRTVSKLHAVVGVRPEGVRIRDSGSTNGTYVDGVRVRDANLGPASVVRLGSTTLRVEDSNEPVQLELSQRTALGRLVGGSAAMRQVYALIERVAPTATTVLIQGETGTGKELAARALHDLSPRAAGRFVAIDCGAIPDNLIESELFGHVRGAFSGAVTDRAGVFEEADGGTLFFDEIGELSLQLQRKLLRAIETRELRRVGSNKEHRVNVRVVAATHRPLGPAVNLGLFREDLYYRLAVVTLELPPLRARREDIPLLAQHFLERFMGSGATFGTELLASLASRGWPGNVRELRNFIERYVALSADGAEQPSTLPETGGVHAAVDTNAPYKEALDAWVAQFEHLYVRALLEKTDGNVTRAANVAGVSRRFLQRQMLRLGLRDAGPADDEGESGAGPKS